MHHEYKHLVAYEAMIVSSHQLMNQSDQRYRWSKQNFTYIPFTLYVRSRNTDISMDELRFIRDAPLQDDEDSFDVPDIIFDSYVPPEIKVSKEVRMLHAQASWFNDDKASRKKRKLAI